MSMRIGDSSSYSSQMSVDQTQRRPPPRNRETDEKVMGVIADKLGTTSDDLKTQLESGAKLDDLLSAKGVSQDDLRSAIQDALGSSTSASSTTSTDSTESTDETRPSGPPPGPPPGMGGPGGPGGPGGGKDDKVTSAIAETLGMSTDDLQSALQSGKSLDDLLTENDVSQDDLLAAIQTSLQSEQTYGQSGRVQAMGWAYGGQQIDTTA